MNLKVSNGPITQEHCSILRNPENSINMLILPGPMGACEAAVGEESQPSSARQQKRRRGFLVCIYVCMSVCMYVCMYEYVYIYMYR